MKNHIELPFHQPLTRSSSRNSALILFTLLLALALWPEAAFAQGSGLALLTTINNPTPAPGDLFGESVAGVGTDRFLVGADGAAEAYLFNFDGKLLTTYTNPTPTGDAFGASVAVVGNDLVFVGAYNYSEGVHQVGKAYLYDTNGALVTTFTNPSPATIQAFGWSGHPLGNDRLLIGTGGNGAYLFRTNGALLTTFTNPLAPGGGGFGYQLVAVGSDRVLVGAQEDNTGASTAGAAFLFDTNGTLVMTFTNPAPVAGDNFGTSLAAVDSSRVLISAIDYGAAHGTGGAAYLFNTNGTLLTTFTNPTPALYDYFGWSVAAVGGDRVLIGAYQDGMGTHNDGTGLYQAGAAYLYRTNGILLNTFTNPTPADQDWFAWSVAAVGSDRVIIGGIWDDTGAPDAGSVYLYTLPYPPLSVARNAGAVSVSWVTPETGLVLQQAGLLGPLTVWSNTTNTVSVNNLTNAVQQTIATGTNRFYRLLRP